jgi:uncharacterized cupin superfamily protein
VIDPASRFEEATVSSDQQNPIVHIDEVEEISYIDDGVFGHHYKVLTPSMRARGGSLGVNVTRLPPGNTSCPFHSHQREDEVFFVLSGRGVLRYGDTLTEIRAGHCVSCPAGTGVAHQIANPFDADLVYIAMGPHDPNEVCVYPDSGKVMVRSLKTVGHLNATAYMEGEPEQPRIFEMWKRAGAE